MNLEQLDQLLKDWRKKVDLASQNLIDLYGLPTYQRLAGTSGFPKTKLTGITEVRVTSALEVMTELFQHFDLLLDVVNKAIERRKQLPRFLGAEPKIQEIEQLLTGASIHLAVVQIPLAQRGLLSAAETANAITPNDLLTAMMGAFQVAKDVVLAVDEAWLCLEPALVDAESEVSSLQTFANSLDQASLNELVITRQELTALRTKIESNPLGVSADFDREIKPRIARLKTTLERLVKQQNQIRANLEIAHELMTQLIDLNQQAIAAFTESKEKVVDHSMLRTPLEQEKIDALKDWLTRLETKMSEGLLTSVGVGLNNWITKAKEYIASEQETWEANKTPLDTRQELRGRLDALIAKALARGLVENATLSELAAQAKQLLYTRPTPLAKAAELVSLYEKRLNS